MIKSGCFYTLTTLNGMVVLKSSILFPFATHMASSRVVSTTRHILKTYKNIHMKKVLTVAIMLTVFAIILRANIFNEPASFEVGVCAFILSFLASTVIVTISEVMKIDKEVAEDNKQYTELYTNPKTTSMIDQNDSLED